MRWYFLPFSLMLAGCATVANKGELHAGDTAYLVGPLNDIKELPAPTEKTVIDGREVEIELIGVSLGWFDEVQVLEVRGDQVKFTRPIAYHPANTGWAPKSAFLRDSDFIPLTAWPMPGTYSYCVEEVGCFSLEIHSDATFSLSQTTHDWETCVVADVKDEASKCATTGTVYAARGYFKLNADSGFKDFLVDLGEGKVCRVGYWNDSFKCKPDGLTFKPL